MIFSKNSLTKYLLALVVFLPSLSFGNVGLPDIKQAIYFQVKSPVGGTQYAAPGVLANVPVDSILSIEGLMVIDIEPNELALIGPHGVEKIKVIVDAEQSTVSIEPKQELFPGSSYSLVVTLGENQGASAKTTQIFTFNTEYLVPRKPDSRLARADTRQESGSSLLMTEPHEHFTFPKTPHTDDEVWTPGSEHLKSNWRTDKPLPEEVAQAVNLALSNNSILAYGRQQRTTQQEPITPAISGVVFKLNDEPLAGVTVSVGEQQTATDIAGRYTISNLLPGHHQLIIGGQSAIQGEGQFAETMIGLQVYANQTTPVKPVYLPKVRETDWIEIPSPLTEDIIVQSREMPGFEIHLPAGTVVRDRSGDIIRRIATIPMPLDRVPIEYPVNTPLHMTLQPAGMQFESLDPGVASGVKFVYPNYAGNAPGDRAGFLNYDPSGKGWYTYGYGTVSLDGMRVLPDEDTVVYSATGFGISFGPNPPPTTTSNECGDPARDGDPVDLKTGLFIHETQGPQLQDVMPLSFNTKYRPGDDTVRGVGRGAMHSYDAYLYFPGTSGHDYWYEMNLVLPDCSVLKFEATTPPDGARIDWQAIHLGSPSPFYGATMRFARSNSIGNIILMTQRDGTSWEFSLHGGDFESITDRYGRQVEITRGNGGRIVRITSPSGRYIDVTQASNRGITRLIDMSGRSWSYRYNTAGYLDQVTYPDNTIETFVYDANNRMEEVYNRLGQRMVKNTYDANGRVIEQVLADGAQYSFDYVTDSTGEITETFVVKPNGSMRHVTFHSSGYPASDTEAFGSSLQRSVVYERDSVGFVTAMTDPLNRRSEFDYDADKQLTAITAMAGTASARTTSYSYDSNYDIESITDPNHDQLIVTWDDQRRLLAVEDNHARRISLGYDSLSRLRTMTDHLNRQTRLGYLLFDVVSVTDPHDRVSRRLVDAMGRVSEVHDPQSRVTKFDYDVNDNIQKVYDGANQMTQYSFDALGNLTHLTDPTNRVTEWGYDARQRLILVTDALNQVSTCNFAADELSVSCIDRGNRETQMSFDLLTRLSNVAYQSDGSNVSLSYDIADRLTQIDDTLGGTLVYAYDVFDQMTQEITATGTTAYDYDQRLRLTNITPAGLTPVSYGYDTRDRLTSITQGSDVVTMTYDAFDRRNRVTLPNGVSTTANYDTLDRLTALTYQQGSLSLGNLTYVYDEAGQIISKGGSWDDPILPTVPSIGGQTDANHRLLNWDNQILEYDVHGNLLDDGTFTYEYDSRDRLITMYQGGSLFASFHYDAMGRRTEKTINGQTTSYRYDGENPIAEISNGNTKQILAGPGIDERYARDDDNGRSYFLTDNLGSTVALTGENGELQGRYRYEAYGESQFEGAGGFTSSNSYQYTGRENDSSGLYYYRARYYSPTAKRFTQEDPLGFIDGPNPYAYVGGNPMSYSDPTGKFIFNIVAGFVEGFIAGSNAKKQGASGWEAFGSFLVGTATGLVNPSKALGWLAPAIKFVVGAVGSGVKQVLCNNFNLTEALTSGVLKAWGLRDRLPPLTQPNLIGSFPVGLAHEAAAQYASKKITGEISSSLGWIEGLFTGN